MNSTLNAMQWWFLSSWRNDIRIVIIGNSAAWRWGGKCRLRSSAFILCSAPPTESSPPECHTYHLLCSSFLPQYLTRSPAKHTTYVFNIYNPKKECSGCSVWRTWKSETSWWEAESRSSSTALHSLHHADHRPWLPQRVLAWISAPMTKENVKENDRKWKKLHDGFDGPVWRRCSEYRVIHRRKWVPVHYA